MELEYALLADAAQVSEGKTFILGGGILQTESDGAGDLNRRAATATSPDFRWTSGRNASTRSS